MYCTPQRLSFRILFCGLSARPRSRWRCVVAPIVAGAVVMTERKRIAQRIQIVKRKLRFYDMGLARLAHVQDSAGEGYRDVGHLYTEDLHVFGSGPLFSLLCTARTGAGQTTLAEWLSEPGSALEVRRRQEAVEELRGRLDLRERIAVSDAERTVAMDPAALLSWIDRGPVRFPPMARYIALFAALLAVVMMLLSLDGFYPYRAFFFSLAPEVLLAGILCQRVRIVIESIALPALDLMLVAELLIILEREVFPSPLLQKLQARLKTGSVVASAQVQRLGRLAKLLNERRNDVFGVSYLLLWGTQFAMAIETWRQSFGEDLRAWLGVLGEFEALNSIAGYAYEHPDDPFPVLLETSDAVFESTGLGHPMIPAGRCVRNDIRLGEKLQVLVVSGSNMSGKSTFLRAVGLNAVLAWAGAPVRAQALRLSRLAVSAAIQIEDSLENGQSRFAAEVVRLRRIMDRTTGSTPVLFLLDEVLSGTNSRDRRIGVEIIVRYLLDRGAIGLVTTHDLPLTEIADSLHPRGRNIYFEDSFDDGKMAFDYRARTGVLTRSNALALMRSLGIEV